MKTLLADIKGQPLRIRTMVLHKAWEGTKILSGLANDDYPLRRKITPLLIEYKIALQAELAKDDITSDDRQYYSDWIREIDKTLSRY
jgi:hypothetical protein